MLPSSMTLGRVAQLTERARANLGTLLLARDDRGRAEAEAALDKTDQELKPARAAYETTITPGEEHQLAAAFSQAWDAYGAIGTTVRDLRHKGDQADATTLFTGTAHERMNGFRTALQADIDFNGHTVKATGAIGEAVYDSSRGWIAGALTLATLIAAVAGLGIIRGVARPITATTGAMRRLAEHDMTQRSSASAARMTSARWPAPCRSSRTTS
ncbi:MAG TPA: MCP four helix bundle domain-containing protein [Acetobacteraceae bacterium]|nr:MCP four helix bundle domain-containing protein [Acetobacteraceae bacterium]